MEGLGVGKKGCHFPDAVSAVLGPSSSCPGAQIPRTPFGRRGAPGGAPGEGGRAAGHAHLITNVATHRPELRAAFPLAAMAEGDVTGRLRLGLGPEPEPLLQKVPQS